MYVHVFAALNNSAYAHCVCMFTVYANGFLSACAPVVWTPFFDVYLFVVLVFFSDHQDIYAFV